MLSLAVASIAVNGVAIGFAFAMNYRTKEWPHRDHGVPWLLGAAWIIPSVALAYWFGMALGGFSSIRQLNGAGSSCAWSEWVLVWPHLVLVCMAGIAVNVGSIFLIWFKRRPAISEIAAASSGLLSSALVVALLFRHFPDA